jgi:hypothetical protein
MLSREVSKKFPGKKDKRKLISQMATYLTNTVCLDYGTIFHGNALE